jgi:ribonuclease P protein component
MKRSETIKDKKLFTDIIKTGKYKKNNYIVIYNKERKDDKLFFGIAISNKFGHAHLRNRIKRQTRAVIDNNKNLFQKGNNYIIMIRKNSSNIKFKLLEESIVDLLKDKKGD